MSNVINISRYISPFGMMLIGSYEGQICLCAWAEGCHRKLTENRVRRALNAEYLESTSPIILKTIQELNEFFNSERKTFDVPLLMTGSPFQNKVWQSLQDIPYGMTISYARQASIIGMSTAVRAVANADGANPISIIIPCHRVIGSDGSLTGYAGGINIKKSLLSMELLTQAQ